MLSPYPLWLKTTCLCLGGYSPLGRFAFVCSALRSVHGSVSVVRCPCIHDYDNCELIEWYHYIYHNRNDSDGDD